MSSSKHIQSTDMRRHSCIHTPSTKHTNMGNLCVDIIVLSHYTRIWIHVQIFQTHGELEAPSCSF